MCCVVRVWCEWCGVVWCVYCGVVLFVVWCGVVWCVGGVVCVYVVCVCDVVCVCQALRTASAGDALIVIIIITCFFNIFYCVI